MEDPELEQETMQVKYFQPCCMQVTSHGAINISQLETAVPGAKRLNFIQGTTLVHRKSHRIQ